MLRQISHKNLMGLRTGGSFSDLSAWYGASNKDANDHSQYLHRDGFDSLDVGGGYNLIRGDLLIGSSDVSGAVPHYNIDLDSRKVIFGTTDGPYIHFDKSFTQDIPNGWDNIPASFTDEVLRIVGADDGAGLRTVLVDSEFRVNGNVVLGTTTDHDVVIPGQLYVNDSLFLRPRADKPSAKEGLLIYDSTTKGVMYWDGADWTRISTYPYAKVVGAVPGATNATLQEAIDEVPAGSRILVVGTITLTDTVNINKNSIKIEGLSPDSIIDGNDIPSNTAGFNITGTRCVIKGLNFCNFTDSNTKAIYVNGEGFICAENYFDPSNSINIEFNPSLSNAFSVYGNVDF